MNKQIIISLILILLISCAGMQATQTMVKNAELVDFGELNINEVKTIEKSTTATGKYNVGSVKSVNERTSEIIAQKQKTFGIIYKVIGEPDGDRTTLTIKAVHPPIKGNTISSSKVYVTIGSHSYAYYTFNEDYEIKEGEWKIQVWNRDKILIEKIFKVKK